MSSTSTGSSTSTATSAAAPAGHAVWHAYTDDIGFDAPALSIVRGLGAWLVDAHGRRLLNGFGGLSMMMGHGNEVIEGRIRDQLDRLASSSTFRMSHPGVEELASRLVAIAPGAMARALFVNSGSEAVEAAVKAARAYHHLRGAGHRSVVYAFDRSYHGTSLGTMPLSGIYPNAIKLFAVSLVVGIDELKAA